MKSFLNAFFADIRGYHKFFEKIPKKASTFGSAQTPKHISRSTGNGRAHGKGCPGRGCAHARPIGYGAIPRVSLLICGDVPAQKARFIPTEFTWRNDYQDRIVKGIEEVKPR